MVLAWSVLQPLLKQRLCSFLGRGRRPYRLRRQRGRVFEVESRGLPGRAPHVREGGPWFWDEEAGPANGSMDRLLWRLASGTEFARAQELDPKH